MELVDSKTLQRRLNKSVKLAEKLRQKNLYECEANKELAKRNHVLRKSVLLEQKKVERAKALVNSLESLVDQNDSFPSNNILNADLLPLLHELKEALNETEPVVVQSPPDEPQTKSGRVNSRRQSSLFVHLPELSGTSLVRKSADCLKTHDISMDFPDETVPDGCRGPNMMCTPLFEHFLVIGASSDSATEFAQLIQSFEDDSLSNRFMRTLGGFLSHPRFMMGSNGLKTPNAGSSISSSGIAATAGSSSIVPVATPVKLPIAPHSTFKEETVNDFQMERRESSLSMELRPSEEAHTSGIVSSSASKSIFSYFSRSSNTNNTNNSASVGSAPHHQGQSHSYNSAAADLLKAIADDGEIRSHNNTTTIDDNAIDRVESVSDLKLDLDSESLVISDPSSMSASVGVAKSPSKDSETSPVGGQTQIVDESPSKSAANLIAGTTSALNRFGGYLNRLSVASDKTANAVVSSALKGTKVMPNLNRNRSSSAADISLTSTSLESDGVATGDGPMKPLALSTSNNTLNDISESATVASTSDVGSLIGSPVENQHQGMHVPAPITIPTVPSKHVSSLTHSDKKAGYATTEGTILYRYPPTVEPPPPEISDFCLPLGGKLRRLFHKDEDTMVQEILFGHSHSKRSGKCFIFLLEDKTTADNVNDDEAGIGTGRLYGICVTHPRLIKTGVVCNQNQSKHTAGNNSNTNAINNTSNNTSNNNNNVVSRNIDDNNGENEKDVYEFESSVCYAFITRFPLFDFFFQIIFDMITLERLVRMEMAVDQSDADMKYSRNVYQYLPQTILENCLERLTRLTPPRYNERTMFSISKSIQSIECYRPTPKDDFPEHYANAADWALPTLLSWMPIETIVWSLSLLMTESKLIIVGYDSGMVSCAVMGLLVLLRPLEWVAPLIPMLPLKLIDFIESPVPILAGLTLDATEKTMEANKLLERCSDPSDGTVLAVLDVTKRELYVSSAHKQLLKSLAMPNSDVLAENLRSCLSKDFHEAKTRGRPLYAVSNTQKAVSRHAHDVFTSHVQGVIALAVEWVAPKEISSVHSQSQLISAADGFSDSDEASEDEDDEETAAAQNSLLEYYANMVGEDGDKSALEIATNVSKQEAANANLNHKLNSQGRYKRSTSISSHGSNSVASNNNANITSNQVVAASVSNEPLKLTSESLKDTNSDGFLKRFRFTQLFSEHIGDPTNPGSNEVIPTSDLAKSDPLFDGFDNDALSDMPGNRLSLTGSANGSRRQSMNLMFTQDHKLRLESTPSASTSFTASTTVSEI